MPYKDPEKEREYKRKYRSEHLEISRERSRKYYREHREEVLAKNRAWALAHKDRISERKKLRRKSDPDFLEREHQSYAEWVRKNRGTRLRITRTYYHRNYLESRKRHWKRQGIDIDAAEFIWNTEPHICAICGESSRLQMDHNHATGKPTGFLCKKCNMGIGLLQSSSILLSRAAEFVRTRYG